MSTVTISSGFRITIPREIRKALNLEVGQQLQAILYENRLQLLPFRSVKSMRGFVRGIDTRVARGRDRV